MIDTQASSTPEETFNLGKRIGELLRSGDLVLLRGELGAGKTLLTKGILEALSFDVDEVTSPSFTLVNLYRTPRFDVYHIDLWRLEEGGDIASAVGLDDILTAENSVTIIEWSEKLRGVDHPGRTVTIRIEGDGDEPRTITIDGL